MKLGGVSSAETEISRSENSRLSRGRRGASQSCATDGSAAIRTSLGRLTVRIVWTAEPSASNASPNWPTTSDSLPRQPDAVRVPLEQWTPDPGLEMADLLRDGARL